MKGTQSLLKALQRNYELLCCIAENTSETSLQIAPQTMVPSFTAGVAVAGSVLEGARSVTFFNSGATNTTVAGGTLLAGRSVTFSAGGESDVLTEISYDPLASTLDIAEIRPQ